VSLPDFFDNVYWSLRFQRSEDPTVDSVREVASRVIPEIRASTAASRERGCAEGIRVLVNLLARTFGAIALNVEPGLRGELVKLAVAINPRIDVRSAGGTHVIGIGDVPADGVLVWMGGRGWTASISRHIQVPTQPNRAAGLVAAVLAYGELFKIAFATFLGARWEATTEAHLSLLTYRVTDAPEPEPVGFPERADIGEVHLVGVGAIGFAFLAALRVFPVVGRIHAIDNQKVELSNLQRYLLAYHDDVMRQPKVNVAKREMARTRVTVTVHQSTWERFLADQPPGWRFRRVVTALDSAWTRQLVQASLPLEIFNGGVARSVFDIGRFGFDGTQECLNCAYQRAPPPPLFDLMLATFGLPPPRLQQLEDGHLGLTVEDVRVIETRVQRPGALRHLVGLSLSAAYMRMCGFVIADNVLAEHEPALVPAAHVPVFAGVLLAIELLKAAVPELAPFRLEHVLQCDIRYRVDPSVRLTQIWGVGGPCICTDRDYQQSYREKWSIR
jgi:molybdopterin/thiamine biosynthesis adenylyltransferase